MARPEETLPEALLKKGSFDDKSYAWPADVIPEVIEAAKKAGLVNLGGHLEVRWGGWSYPSSKLKIWPVTLPEGISWRERVEQTAEAALADFQELCDTQDFHHLCVTEFPEVMDECVKEGGNPEQAVCFTWRLADELLFDKIANGEEAQEDDSDNDGDSVDDSDGDGDGGGGSSGEDDGGINRT